MSDPIYRASPGFRISHKDAAILGPAWEKLERRLKRAPTPTDLAEEAKNPKSAFHPYFEWDPIKQQQIYLVERARYLIMALDVILPDHGDEPVRGVIPTFDGSGGFMSTRKAAAERPDVIAAQVQRARADARGVVERYQAWVAFSEFKPARSFIEAAKDFAYES